VRGAEVYSRPGPGKTEPARVGEGAQGVKYLAVVSQFMTIFLLQLTHHRVPTANAASSCIAMFFLTIVSASAF
jgi:hypothetical protein